MVCSHLLYLRSGKGFAMKLAIIGSRSYTNKQSFGITMDQWFPSGHWPDEIISGGAAGADSLAYEWATSRNIKTTVFLPDWNRYGKSAGYRRNVDIIKAADTVLGFWDGVSAGTKHSLNLAHEARKPTLIIYV
jgi:hypothetical protein